MPIRTAYRFSADVSLDGERLGQVPLSPDWEQALQWSQFEGVRRGRLPPNLRPSGGRIEPQWDPERGRPHVTGFRVHHRSDEGEFVTALPKSYLDEVVVRAAAGLVAKGALESGRRIAWEVCAFAVGEDPASQGDGGGGGRDFGVEEVPQPLPLGCASLARHREGARVLGAPDWSDDDVPIFVRPNVLAEAAAASRAAGDLETGGVLVGRLYRDTETPEVFCVVEAQIAARHTRAAAKKLTFTAETWSAAQDAIALRGRNEMLCGWWHFHPYFCRDCSEEGRRVCPYARPFFSLDDVALHRTVFGRAFTVAVLLSDLGADDLACDCFGWRQGAVAHRGYYVLDEDGGTSTNRGER